MDMVLSTQKNQQQRSATLQRGMKTLLGLLLACSVFLGIQLPTVALDEVKINILHTNDVHGRFYEVDSNNTGMIGIDRIAAIKDATDNAILVDIGDAVHGLPIVNINRGENAIALMVAAGYDVMTPGNHDFNFGSDRLAELAGIAAGDGLKIISSNIYDTVAADYMLPQTTVITIDGVRLGFFGLTTQTTPTVTSPTNVNTLEFRAYKTSAEAAIAQLHADGADIIVCLAHISHPEILALIDQLAEKPTVVIEGHDHRLGTEVYNGVTIAGSGEYQSNLGLVTITFDKDAGEVVSVSTTVISKADTAAVIPNAAVQALAESIKTTVLDQYSEVVAQSELLLSSARGSYNSSTLEVVRGVRNSEQPLGNLVADAMRVVGGADIAITNGGGLRADIKVGDITRGDLNSVLPFGNVLVIKEATPKALKEIMENGLQFAPAVDGRFPQISGMNVTYDESKPAGSRVLAISVGGINLDLNDTSTIFRLATNDFMAVGGDGYTAIQSLPTLAEVDSLDSAFERYITDTLDGTITAADASVEGRITIGSLVDNVDKTGLLSAIASANTLRQADYTATSWAGLVAALDAAKLIADDDAANQQQVDSALAALQAARSALVSVDTDGSGSGNTGNNTPATGNTSEGAGLAAVVVLSMLGATCLGWENRRRHVKKHAA
ncbi:MAG: 5'-nucleotidase C-terminal domain-containing protein [Coriobacteriales bacterium]|jgi:2',3'-cyclic-nucleotide 2'-phosphodiesterase (5'-nucleotidase family)|nr:5'-nucleotidase C-terminal domain-containing protein [Coriobacteriales bacterium]